MEFKKIFWIKKIIFLFLLAGVLVLGWNMKKTKKNLGQAQEEKVQQGAKKNYYCPMHPHIVSPEKGSCPICEMDLVLEEGSPTPDRSLYLPLDRQQKNWRAFRKGAKKDLV